MLIEYEISALLIIQLNSMKTSQMILRLKNVNYYSTGPVGVRSLFQEV